MAHINWNHPNISKLPPQKTILLKKITDDLTNLNIQTNTDNNTIAYILALSKQLDEANITFSPEEYSILLSSIQK